METKPKLKRIKEVLEEMKAEEIVVIDASHRTILADAFVVATATSDTHARSIGDRMHLALKADGVRAEHSEQDAGREWTILDYGDVVVHIFLESARKFYNLEALWGQVRQVREKKAEAPAAEAATAAAKPKKGAKKPMSPGMHRLAEETRAARGTRSSAPTYRTGAKPGAKGGGKPGAKRGPAKPVRRSTRD